MAAWALISGGLMVAAAVKLHASHGSWWLGLGGVVSLIWGVLLVAAPLMGAVVLTWWLGLYAIVFGIALLTCGWRLRVPAPRAISRGRSWPDATAADGPQPTPLLAFRQKAWMPTVVNHGVVSRISRRGGPAPFSRAVPAPRSTSWRWGGLPGA